MPITLSQSSVAGGASGGLDYSIYLDYTTTGRVAYTLEFPAGTAHRDYKRRRNRAAFKFYTGSDYPNSIFASRVGRARCLPSTTALPSAPTLGTGTAFRTLARSNSSLAWDGVGGSPNYLVPIDAYQWGPVPNATTNLRDVCPFFWPLDSTGATFLASRFAYPLAGFDVSYQPRLRPQGPSFSRSEVVPFHAPQGHAAGGAVGSLPTPYGCLVNSTTTGQEGGAIVKTDGSGYVIGEDHFTYPALTSGTEAMHAHLTHGVPPDGVFYLYGNSAVRQASAPPSVSVTVTWYNRAGTSLGTSSLGPFTFFNGGVDAFPNPKWGLYAALSFTGLTPPAGACSLGISFGKNSYTQAEVYLACTKWGPWRWISSLYQSTGFNTALRPHVFYLWPSRNAEDPADYVPGIGLLI